MLKSCDLQDFIMCVASDFGTEKEEKAADGVVMGHAYSLLAVNEFEHNGKIVKLVKLRNPWGSHEWKGEWSDNSS